jgi:hypothetical protein
MTTAKAHSLPLDKIAATLAAIPLIAAETGLNAEHIANTAGWMSTLVAGAIGATIAAAAALPIAERALVRGYYLKAAGLGLFFAIMLAFSFSTSVSRVGSKADGDGASSRSHNAKLELAKEAYEAARGTQQAECASGRGPLCRKAEDALTAARAALQTAPAAKAEASMETRLAAATGLSVATVALYQPLLFPLALQLGGFFFLAYGLSPIREIKPAVKIEEKPMAKVESKVQAKPKPEQKPKATPKPRAATKPKTVKRQQLAANVVSFKRAGNDN